MLAVREDPFKHGVGLGSAFAEDVPQSSTGRLALTSGCQQLHPAPAGASIDQESPQAAEPRFAAVSSSSAIRRPMRWRMTSRLVDCLQQWLRRLETRVGK